MKKTILGIMLLLLVTTVAAGNITKTNVWTGNGYNKITTVDADTLEGKTANEIITAAEYDDTQLKRANKRQNKDIKLNSEINNLQSTLIVSNSFGIVNNRNQISSFKSKEAEYLSDKKGMSRYYMEKYLSNEYMTILLENFALKTEVESLREKVDYLMAKDKGMTVLQYQLSQGNGYAGWKCKDDICIR